MQDLKNLKCLLPKTETLLLKMIDECGFLDKYVLVGGSALAIYLCHRKSEDLDFFTYSDNFDIKDDNIEYLEPIEIISKEEIRDFFQNRIDKMVML